MKAEVIEECIACERCVEIRPEVFEMGDELAQVKLNEIPQEYEQAVAEAAEECPVSAILI